MTHVREELTLGAAPGFGQILGAEQRGLCGFAARDVDQRPFDDPQWMIAVLQKCGADQGPDRCIVLTTKTGLEIRHGAAVDQQLHEAVAFVGVHESVVGRAGEHGGARLKPKQACARLVAVQEAAVERGAVDAGLTALEQ